MASFNESVYESSFLRKVSSGDYSFRVQRRPDVNLRHPDQQLLESEDSADSVMTTCLLCLNEVSSREFFQIRICQCRFCINCMVQYVALKIEDGEGFIECPSSNCRENILSLDEVELLVGKELGDLHRRFRKNKEVNIDPLQIWCLRPDCQTPISLSVPKMGDEPNRACCTKCNTECCAACFSAWHEGTCRKNPGVSEMDSEGIIKRCPKCKIFIERADGCAQMICKLCKHVFCWHCLASLKMDLLLRHYDEGPCQGKLGHNRAELRRYRLRAAFVAAGTYFLLALASPVILIVGLPVWLCKRYCCKKSIPDNLDF